MFQRLRAVQAIVLIATAAAIFAPSVRAESTDQTIYTDSLQNGWQDYGWATLNYSATSPVHSGSDSISITAGAYEALYVHHTAFDSSAFTAVTFWINGGASGGQRLHLQAELTGQPQTAVAIGPLAANTWQQITVPLTSLGATNQTTLDGFTFQDTTGAAQPTFYIDDITLVGVPPPTTFNLTVDPTTSVRPLDSRIYGVNTAIWDVGLASSGTSALLSANGTASLRYPGGSAADIYNWSTNLDDGNPAQWATPFPTFAKLAEYLGAKPYITVNYGNGTPQMAAAWVAYSNGSPSSTTSIGVDSKGVDWKTVGYWATMRASSPLATDDGHNFLRISHPTPYGFQYWEIGNENYGNWENDKHGVTGSGLTGTANDGYTYATYFKQFVAAMRAVDPTIKIGAVGIPGEDANGNGTHAVPNPNEGNTTHSGWTAVVLANLKTLNTPPDFIVYHRYPQEPNTESDSVILQASTGWAAAAATYRKMITDYYPGTAGANIELAATESNSVSYNPGKQTTSLVNGLFAADSLGAMAQTEFTACMWWDLYNSSETGYNNSASLYGWRQFGDYGILATGDRGDTPYNTPYPSYYAGKLLTHWGRGGDQIVSATSNSTLLSCYAVKQQNGTVALLVINKNPTTDLTGHITLTNFVPGSSTATVYRYGKSEDLANADLTQTTLTNAGATFDAVFPSYSMSVIDLAPTNPAPSVPANLTATVISASQINLSWAASTGASYYSVYRSTTSGTGRTLIVSTRGTNFSDTGLLATTRYYYIVTAVNATGSVSTPEVSATTPAVPNPATNLTASTISSSQINLAWTGASGASYYSIYRSTTSGTGRTLIVSTRGTNFSDTGLQTGTRYYYVVVAVSPSGSASTPEVSTMTTPAPTAPTNVTATMISSSQINLSWAASTGATYYSVYRSATSGTGRTLIVSTRGTTLSDTGLQASTRYYYVVSAVNASGATNSPEVTAVTHAP